VPGISLGDHCLDLDRGVLLREGAPVHLRARSFALLCFMAARPGQVLDKDTLLDAVWPGLTVTEDSLTQAIRDVRRVLGEGVIRTVPRRGYALEPTAPAAQAAPPRMVVLPLATHSPDAEDRLIADGLAEELTQNLGRFGLLSVVARHSAFQFRPEDVAPEEAARRLDARYFVTGSARRIGGRLAVSLALAVAGGRNELWSERLDVTPDSLGETAVGLTNRIAARLDLDVRRRLADAGSLTGSADAYALFAAGVGLVRSFGDVNERARTLFERALAQDPGFALAHAYLGLAEAIIAGYDAAAPGVLGRAMGHVRRALELAPEEARCHWIAGVICYFARDFAGAELHASRARALNPSDADLLVFSGFVMALRGRPEVGLDLIRHAETLNPLHPAWYHTSFSIVLQMLDLHEEAVAHLRCLPENNPMRLTRLAGSLAALGDVQGARRGLDRAAALSPGWDPVAEAGKLRHCEHARDNEAFVGLVRRAVALCGWQAPGRDADDPAAPVPGT
jgi:TolB-like protein/Flp pilus assembly protein TadD